MTAKAFLFDLDGVLANTEPMWERQKHIMYTALFGDGIAAQLTQTRGVSVDGIYDIACGLGGQVPKDEFVAAHMRAAPGIYDESPLLPRAAELGTFLVNHGYVLAIVSSSPSDWVDRVVRRLPFGDDLQLVLSLQDMDIPQKPAPDGYVRAMEQLGTTPQTTIILEDSNSGITAAKASGAFTITFRELLAPDYQQLAGDALAHTVDDVMRIVAERSVQGPV